MEIFEKEKSLCYDKAIKSTLGQNYCYIIKNNKKEVV
ncbi:hypothetical protein FUSO4_01355 [Fusobacterium necrophorum DJ-1]|uniref:Uncharacterized protein n=2 Tax=Fusobacterium necrophorum TaxID=859 RepID=A0AB73BXJ1_9FUSO|nr:hypothetical protein FUSO5_11445 [Fusobacterium necrophorum BFTR-1]KDE64133.1 hypothetical protein FUSO3_03520 [Fusobacterium necrophorum BL]KDE68141.1 hypothetical protein FUSO4_01355 [Fusobacterium necrophorum DJ-1]KDE69315.1 hypothetical protein FUSO8_11710 [Fusobacterium necrophorum DJ-2]KDE71588.1 hypothetical protein FUSO6_00365 [Fusobacterium necrophorum DAB]